MDELFDAYDTIAKMWLPNQVPASWFETFGHLSRTGPDGETHPDAAPPKPIDQMTVAELNAYAEANGIDVEGATKKADLVAAIQAAIRAGLEQTGEHAGGDA